jgi:hypothetical protein
MNIMQNNITAWQGFKAMEKCLAKWYGYTKSDDIGYIYMGLMSDPGFADDWEKAIAEVIKDDVEQKAIKE